MTLLHPVAQRVEDHPRHDGVRQVEGVAASGDVDVTTATVDAVVGALVEPAPREGHVLPRVLRRVVVDDVEQHLDAGGVQVLDHRLELVEGALRVRLRRVRRVRREEAERVVAPVVGQPAQHEVGLVREGVDREQLECRDPEALQVVDEGGVGEAGIRPTELVGDAGVQHRGVLDVDLVEQRLGERTSREIVCPPVELVVDDDAAWHVWCRVAVVADPEVAPEVGADAVGVEGGIEVHAALDGARVGVEQQLRRVVQQRPVGVPVAVDAEGVALAGPDARHGVEPGPVGAVAQRHAPLRRRAVVGLVEQADLDRARVAGVDAELGAVGGQSHPELRGQVGHRVRRRTHVSERRGWPTTRPGRIDLTAQARYG